MPGRGGASRSGNEGARASPDEPDRGTLAATLEGALAGTPTPRVRLTSEDEAALAQVTRAHLDEVVDEIWAGRCVAFVGAGFSAAAGLPDWNRLLMGVAARIPGPEGERLLRALDNAHLRSRQLEAIGQLLQDALGPDGFREAVREVMGQLDEAALPPAFRARRAALRQLPFRAILTTNFDPLLSGSLTSTETYRSLLREHPTGPWHPRYWPPVSVPVGEDAQGAGPPVVQLHGSVDHDRIVFARRDYQRLLFGDPAYLSFLRALFATQTILFLGFSFRDAYLNHLRAELMSLIEPPEGGATSVTPVLSYAVQTELTRPEVVYYRRHEGLRVLWYPWTPDHEGFDRLLEALADRTNPLRRLRRRLRERRVLWMDPTPGNNAVGQELLTGGGGRPITTVPTVPAALEALGDGRGWDLVITHWGHGRASLDGAPVARAQLLLHRMQQGRVRCPVIVFCDPDHAAENRREALRWGAAELACTWGSLFRAVDRVLPGGDRPGAGAPHA